MQYNRSRTRPYQVNEEESKEVRSNPLDLPAVQDKKILTHLSLFGLHEILLWVAFKQPFAGRTTEIEISTLESCVVHGSGYFYFHAANGINSSTWGSRCYSIFCGWFAYRNLIAALFDSRASTPDLHEFSQDACRNFIRRDCSKVKPGGYAQACNLRSC